MFFFFFFQAEDGIRDHCVTGVQTCALPIYAEIMSPINTVGCTASGGSPSTASRSSAAATCVPLCGLIPYEVLCGASHRPGEQDGRGAPLPARQPFRGGRRAGRGWQSNDRDPVVWVVAGSPRPPQPARVAGDP